MSLPEREPSRDAAGFVLAGGQSSRMGTDKALVSFAGGPLVARAVGILRAAGVPAWIAGARSPLAGYAPVVEDKEPGLGPLAGICAALGSCSAALGVFLPVDLPLMPASLIALLVDHARITGAAATLVSVNGFAQTFPVVVDCGALPALEAALHQGQGGCFAGFRAAAERLGRELSILPVELLVQCGRVEHPDGLPPALWFLNGNTPEEMARAEALVPARHRVS